MIIGSLKGKPFFKQCIELRVLDFEPAFFYLSFNVCKGSPSGFFNHVFFCGFVKGSETRKRCRKPTTSTSPKWKPSMPPRKKRL